ncbi:PEP-CTERM sorting domain-containing protein [Verrucomicrobium sp. BvORR034]|uniref:PEP-CTERM sorting domain-containing protein n=1 Tax=Verrucomicrobium sp. BvORR034 TaxID=1396418 RepID=UPI00067910B0|nr:PEP-CTERM sorting domain-containing protein [Verrucomicrobium sp. BvORR034]
MIRPASRISPSLLALGLWCLCTLNASATVFLIDLNENAGSPLPSGQTWNTYAAPANITGATILNSTGQSSSVTFSVTGTITDNTANFGTAVFDPNQSGVVNLPSWVVSAGANGAAGDNFFTNNSTTTAASYTLTFGGLTAGDIVSIDLLASRNSGSALGFFDYSLDGGSTWTGFRVLNADGTIATTNGWDTNTTKSQEFGLQSQGFVLHRYLNAADLTLTGSSLMIRTTDANTSTNTFSAINAIQVTVTPEPTTGALLMMAMACLGCRRRRTGKV